MRTTVSRIGAATAVVTSVVVAWAAGPARAQTAELQRLSPGNAIYPAAALDFTGLGDVTASAFFVDVQIPPSPTPNTSTSGCEAADFAGFPSGTVAVIQRGTCTFAVKAANAQAAGAVAVVIFNEGQPGRTDVIDGSLGGPGVTIPVVGTSFAVGQELFQIGPSVLRVATSGGPATCASPPAPGAALSGKNVIVAQPGVVTSGTEGPDVIYGTAGADRIAGLGGDDVIFGLGGADQLSGGDGADTICGGADGDLLDGGAGPDLLSGDDGNDDLVGGAGDDELSGGGGTNRLVGGVGTDVCTPAGQAMSCEAGPAV